MHELRPMFDTLKLLLQKYQPPLVPKVETDSTYDLWSFRPLVIEGRKRSEIFFAGLMIQKSYVGFYFMPVYVQPEIKEIFAPELLNLLKGKSCFHIKSLTPELLTSIEASLKAGFACYQARGWA
jgi:hypothetical protein